MRQFGGIVSWLAAMTKDSQGQASVNVDLTHQAQISRISTDKCLSIELGLHDIK